MSKPWDVHDARFHRRDAVYTRREEEGPDGSLTLYLSDGSRKLLSAEDRERERLGFGQARDLMVPLSWLHHHQPEQLRQLVRSAVLAVASRELESLSRREAKRCRQAVQVLTLEDATAEQIRQASELLNGERGEVERMIFWALGSTGPRANFDSDDLRDARGVIETLLVDHPRQAERWLVEHQSLLTAADIESQPLKGPFSPCQTTEELELWCRVNYPGIHFRLTDADVAAMNETVAQFDRYMNPADGLYRDVKTLRRIRTFEAYDFQLERGASRGERNKHESTTAMMGVSGLAFNNRYYRDNVELTSLLEYCDDTGWSRGRTTASLLSHEFGHALHACLEGTALARDEDRHLHVIFPHSEAFLPATAGPLGTIGGTVALWLEEQDEPISDYARTSDSFAERFAENFASLHHDSPERQPAVVKLFGKLLERVCVEPQPVVDISTLSPGQAAQMQLAHLNPLLAEIGLSTAGIKHTLDAAQSWYAQTKDPARYGLDPHSAAGAPTLSALDGQAALLAPPELLEGLQPSL